MRSNKYLMDICFEIYQKMYEEAEPPLDFYEALDAGYCSSPDWFMNHYLVMSRQREIFDNVTKKYRCNSFEKKQISFEIWLGSSPTGVVSDKKKDL